MQGKALSVYFSLVVQQTKPRHKMVHNTTDLFIQRVQDIPNLARCQDVLV